jgi:protoporphyrinogen oxidase
VAAVRVAVIGGGIAGLVAARDLGRAGADVTVLERAPILGGQAASFSIGPGQEIERYYHFICMGDSGYLGMLDELGIADRLRWQVTDMGLFLDGELHTLGDPLSLLRFPHLRVRDKARFALTTAATKFRPATGWEHLEDVAAVDWLIRSYGERTYRILYQPLLDSKFQEHAPDISAAWMWARLHRLGQSRSRTLKERIGYLVGGSAAYVDALEKSVAEHGMELRPATGVDRIAVEDGRAIGVIIGGQHHAYDAVLSTVPVPHALRLFEGLEGPYFDNLRSLEYLGVLVVTMRLDRSFSRYYWTNVSDARLPMSGVIEATNLHPLPELGGDAILYIPQYLSPDSPGYVEDDQTVVERYCEALSLMNPTFDRSWVKAHWVHRERWTQPICRRGFTAQVPAIRTSVPGLYLTDSYQLHPHDRAISFSTDLGREAARLVLEDG